MTLASKTLFWFLIILQLLKQYQVNADVEKAFCQSLSLNLKCNQTQKYRSIDGRCNNLIRPFLGASNTRFSRLLRTRYRDKKSVPLESVTGSKLPSARQVSLTVFGNTKHSNPKYSQAFSQIAQLIAHDISFILKAPRKNGCCQPNGQLVATPDSNCMYIKVPPKDEIHSGMECLNFIRSLTDHDIECPNHKSTSPAQQINGATSSLDLSPIYGNNLERLNMLRSFNNGKLTVEKRYNTTWPPKSIGNENVCFAHEPRESCYFSGDFRINQGPQLSIVHILFIREHNRIAEELHKLNPQWSDEILFQESRRINIAQYQNIAYYEYFVGIVGKENIKKFEFFYQKSGGDYANDYNSSLDTSVFNEFSSAMFRLPHSLIEGQLRKLSESHEIEQVVRFSNAFFRPVFIEGYGHFESFVRGMVAQPTLSYGKHFDDEIRQYLFRNNNTYGNDLKAIDIQRGRDHGLGSYNDLREFCGLPRAKKWKDFSDLINQSDIDNLKKVYANLNDVDLNVGTSLERPISNNIQVGYTYACIIKIQIKNLRAADRFWYETSDPSIRFTSQQLTEIRKSSFSQIVCKNAGNVKSIQKHSLNLINDVSNPRVKCSAIPTVDLKVFKE